MKLKTLKDLKRDVYGCNSGEVLDIVKQEAIKWVLENRKPKNVEITEREFMKFHNITEDDLKVTRDLQ